MKTLILILAICVMSCTTDDDTTQPTPETFYEVIYDSQDNIVKLNNTWIQSINLGNFEPANETLGIRHDWDNRTLYIKSNNYIIKDIVLLELGHYVTITENVATIYVPLMHQHMDGTDWFRLNVILTETY